MEMPVLDHLDVLLKHILFQKTTFITKYIISMESLNAWYLYICLYVYSNHLFIDTILILETILLLKTVILQ